MPFDNWDFALLRSYSHADLLLYIRPIILLWSHCMWLQLIHEYKFITCMLCIARIDQLSLKIHVLYNLRNYMYNMLEIAI
jgi:hypothetical protein